MKTYIERETKGQENQVVGRNKQHDVEKLEKISKMATLNDPDDSDNVD